MHFNHPVDFRQPRYIASARQTEERYLKATPQVLIDILKCSASTDRHRSMGRQGFFGPGSQKRLPDSLRSSEPWDKCAACVVVPPAPRFYKNLTSTISPTLNLDSFLALADRRRRKLMLVLYVFTTRRLLLTPSALQALLPMCVGKACGKSDSPVFFLFFGDYGMFQFCCSNRTVHVTAAHCLTSLHGMAGLANCYASDVAATLLDFATRATVASTEKHRDLHCYLAPEIPF